MLDHCFLLPFVGVRERIPELLEPEFPLRKEPSLQRSREAAQVKLVFLIGFLRPRVDVRFGGRFQTLIVGVPSEAVVDTLQRGLTGVTTNTQSPAPSFKLAIVLIRKRNRKAAVVIRDKRRKAQEKSEERVLRAHISRASPEEREREREYQESIKTVSREQIHRTHQRVRGEIFERHLDQIALRDEVAVS